MDLQDKIVSLSEYKLSFQTSNDNFIISIIYKDKWAVIEPANKDIGFFKDDKTPNKYYYVAKLSDSEGLQCIFDTINETIIYNKELEAKISLIKEKCDELYQIFMDKPLEELQTLQFVTKPQPRKKKASASKPKAKSEKKTAPVVDEEKPVEDGADVIDKKIMKSIAQVNEKKGV